MPNDFQNIAWPGWETVSLIGRGSYGAVYEIRRNVLGESETAALKVITIPQNDSDIEEMYCEGYDEESITGSFRNHLKSIVSEYSLMRKMNGCSNIVSCDDVRYVQHEDGIGWDIYIKMELLSPLTKALPEEVPDETVIRIAKDICSALVICKKYDIVHRDIKPQNIFVSPNGDYKLGDFGIAKTIEKTSGGTKIGTYKYMAPEVYHNQPYGVSADIYSLGLVLYWMLNQRRMPFLPLPPVILSAGMDENARLRRLSGEPLPAPASGSKELQAVVLKACAYDPRDRYHTAAEMLEDLERLDRAPVQEAIPVPYPASYPTQYPNLKGDPDATVGASFYGIHHQAQKPEAAVQQPQQYAAQYSDPDATVGPAFYGAHYSQPQQPEPAVQQPQQPEPVVQQPQQPEPVMQQPQQYAAQYSDPDATVGPAFYGAHYSQPQQPEHAVQQSYQPQQYAAQYSDPDATVGPAFYGAHFAQAQNDPAVQQPQPSDPNSTVGPAFYGAHFGQTQNNPAAQQPQQPQQYGAQQPQQYGAQQPGSNAAAGAAAYGAPYSQQPAPVAQQPKPKRAPKEKPQKAQQPPKEKEPSKKKKSKVLLIIIIILLLAALGVGAALLFMGQDSNVIIAAGTDHCVVLNDDGSIAVSGTNNQGQRNVAGWNDLIDIAAGDDFTIGLKSDGTVIVTGNGKDGKLAGQLDVAKWRNVTAVSAGNKHVVALLENGTVVATGDNTHGQIDVAGWHDIVAISAGGYHTVGLRSDGTVVATGLNHEHSTDVSGWRNIVAISAGRNHTVGLTSNGTVVAIGYNSEYGQCEVAGWKDIVAISAGGYHTVGLKSDGTVVAVGKVKYGQCDVDGWKNIVAIGAGGDFTIAIKADGTIVTAGDDVIDKFNYIGSN